MEIRYHKQFDKMNDKLPPKIQQRFVEVLFIFMENPQNPTLRNHALSGEYIGMRSIDITGDYRAIFREYPNGTYEFVEFRKIGTHSQLYK
jgi:addiction module RelE/StbE family toxin